MSSQADPPADFHHALARLGGETLRALHALEATFRFLDPERGPELRARLAALRAPLREAGEGFAAEVPEGLEAFHERFARGASQVEGALELLCESGEPGAAAARALGAMQLHARAQETLYPLRLGLPPLDRYFLEAPLHERLAELAPRPGAAGVGLHRGGSEGAERERFMLYVPEWLPEGEPRPLVVALHGGMGSGRDFLWTWLREARSRGFLLLAPSSRGSTWSLQAPDADGAALRAMVDHVQSNWAVDAGRVLLTGLSDGGTFALLVGLAAKSPFTHLASVAGVFHPGNFALGNLERAEGRPIRLVHGVRDWLFPVSLARAACDVLVEAGAELVYRELDDLSHAYPREENDAMARWLDPSLAHFGPR